MGTAAPGIGWWREEEGADQPTSWMASAAYLLGGGMVAGALGALGAAARQDYLPDPRTEYGSAWGAEES